MSYPFLNSDNIQIREIIPFPAIGGLDLVTDKLSVNPGTLQDCMNYEVSRESGYKLQDGLLRYSGKSFNTVHRWYSGQGYDPGHTWLVFVKGFHTEESPDTLNIWKRDGNSWKLHWLQSEPWPHAPGPGEGKDSIDHLRISPDQTKIVISGGGGLAQHVRLLSFDNVEGISEHLFSSNAYSRGWSADWTLDSTKIVQTASSNVILYGVKEDDTLETLDTDSLPNNGASVARSPDGNFFVVSRRSTDSPNVYLYEINEDDKLIRLDTEGLEGSRPWGGNGISWSPDGTYIAVVTDVGNTVQLLKLDTEPATPTITRLDGISATSSLGVTFDRTGKYIITAEEVFEINESEQLVKVKNTYADGISMSAGTVAIDNDNIYMAITSRTGDPHVFIGSFDDSNADTSLIQTETISDDSWANVRGIEFSSDIGRLYEGGEYDFDFVEDTTKSGTIKVIRLDGDTLQLQLLSGDTPDGDNIVIYPEGRDSSEIAFIDNVTIKTHSSVTSFINDYKTINHHIATDSFPPPGDGPITALFELDDKVYAVRDLEDGSRGQLYTTTDLTDLDKDVEWEAVDMGNILFYKNGRNEPITIYDREFLEEEIELAETVEDRLGGHAESIQTINASGTSTTSSVTGAWASPQNALEDETSGVAAETKRTIPENAPWKQSQILRITEFDIGQDRPNTARVVGIKADIKAAYKLHLGTIADFRMKTAELVGVGGSDNKADTTITQLDTSIESPATSGDIMYSLGGIQDTWNAQDLSTNSVYGEKFGLDLVFEAKLDTMHSGSTHPTAVFMVEWVKFTVYFEDGTERIYFWNGETDVAEADLIGYTVDSGRWSTNNAAGEMTLYDVLNPENIVADLQIRSAADGAGAYIADTDGQLASGTLPTSEDLEEHNSRFQTIKSNFYIDESKEAIYGVTGASRAFVWDGRFLRNINASLPESKDKPRHVAAHQDHLVLGYAAGSILVSVPVEPTNFEGVDGASEWGLGDPVTGLVPLKGNALGIFCEQSSHALIGTSIDNFTQQTISRSAGAIEYSAVNMGQPIYCDFFGISNVSTTEQYGDFDWNRLSRSVSPWIQSRTQESSGARANYPSIVTALPVRSKNQYRLYFSDGTNLTMTIAPAGESDMPMFTFHNYSEGNEFGTEEFVPTAELSTILSSGKELVMIGTASGDIYVLNQGTGILTNSQLYEYDASLTFNPFNGEAPITNLKYSEAFLHMKHSGGQELTATAGVNYLQPVPSAYEENLTAGDLQNNIDLDLVPDKVVAHLPSVTDGFSLKLSSTGDGNLPHIVQAITYKVAATSMRNAAPKRY